MIEIRLATTPEEKEAVYRFRYTVYVEEMGRYRSTADHANKRLFDPEDDHSWIVYAHDGTSVVGSTRITWGGDGFSERQIDQYNLAPFLDEIPGGVMAVGERTMISPSWRGVDLFAELAAGTKINTAAHDVRVVFGACEPHLLSFYCRFQRTFAPRNINSQEAGYLVPLISFPQGPDALIGLGDDPDSMPRCVQTVLDGTGTARNALLCGDDEYSSELCAALTRLPATPFDGFSHEEIVRCVQRSSIVVCEPGDRVIKKGGVARNVFVVLDGQLEARDETRVVGVLQPGDLFGETAFLLRCPRGLDVYAVDPGTRILSLSERTLRSTTADDAGVAAKLFENMSKVLCSRLDAANARATDVGSRSTDHHEQRGNI